MPSIDFTLPHWLYWSALVVFPIIAMVLARQARPQRTPRSIVLAYGIWLVGGFLGFHRLYLKNNWGFLYWPLFACILFANTVERDARVTYSDAVAALRAIDKSQARNEKALARAKARASKARERLSELSTEDTIARKRQQRLIKKNDTRITKAQTQLEKLARERTELTPKVADASSKREQWSSIAFYVFCTICAFLLIDLFLIPGLTHEANTQLRAHPDEPVTRIDPPDDTRFVGTGITGIIDRISLLSGEFVAFWSVIAVFVYYYEVVVRYVFNSPTNWAHESMFLMFGMQYLIAGAYAMLTESHVRVDIFYARFSPRGKALVDLLTSVFFFIFAGALLLTGWIFASDSIRQNEVSFTEWAIQYWPVKIVIVLGSLLLILQGISKLAKDITRVISPNNDAAQGA